MRSHLVECEGDRCSAPLLPEDIFEDGTCRYCGQDSGFVPRRALAAAEARNVKLEASVSSVTVATLDPAEVLDRLNKHRAERGLDPVDSFTPAEAERAHHDAVAERVLGHALPTTPATVDSRVAWRLLDALAAAEARANELERSLLNLLARIHRDGGHYVEKHGLAKAVVEADLIVACTYMDETEVADIALAIVSGTCDADEDSGEFSERIEFVKEAVAGFVGRQVAAAQSRADDSDWHLVCCYLDCIRHRAHTPALFGGIRNRLTAAWRRWSGR